MASSLYQYIGAVFQNWFLYMTAGPFLLDEVFARVFPKTRDRFGKLFPAKVRRRIEVAILFVGVFYAGYAAFNEEHVAKEAERAAKETVQRELVSAKNVTPAPARVEVVQADPQVREELKATREELAVAKKTIHALRLESDPLSKPIASAQVTIALKFSEAIGDQSETNMAGAILAVALVEERTLSLGSSEQPEPLLILESSHYEVTDNQLHAQGTMRFEPTLVGKTIRSLKSATFLQLELPPNFRSEAAGGSVTIVLNGSTSLAFKIPPQTPSQRLGNISAYKIFDIKETLRALD